MTEATGVVGELPPAEPCVGYRLPELTRGPITRATLALFAGASGDHVPLHIDSDYARAAGMDDVFAHGMLSMAYLAQLLTASFRQDQLLSWSVRFLAITPVLSTVHCFGEVVEVLESDGERHIRLSIGARTSDDLHTISGTALVRLDESKGKRK